MTHGNMLRTNALQPPAFPATRLRRLRRTPALRTLVRETTIWPDDFIYTPLRHARQGRAEGD